MIRSLVDDGASLHSIAEAHVSDRKHEKRDRNDNIDEVLHTRIPLSQVLLTSVTMSPASAPTTKLVRA